MGEFIKEVRRVLDAFDDGDEAPQNIAEFITLSKRLQLLFNHYVSFRTTEEGAKSEQYLLEATKHCIACFLMHFEADVLRQLFVSEPLDSDFNTIVHPAYQAIERLLSTASDRAKLFKDECLKEQIHAAASQIFGYVPRLDPPQLSHHFPVSGSAAGTISTSVSANETSFDTGMSSGNSSSTSLSDEINTPSVAQIPDDTRLISTDKVPEATLPASSSRSLAEGMNVNDIISSGLGLSGGHRDQALQTKNDSGLAFRDNTSSGTEQGRLSAVANDSSGESSAVPLTNEPRDPAEKKKKKRRTSRKSGSGRQRTMSSRSSSNKENVRVGV